MQADVLIVGGGMVGLSLAAALAGAGLSVVVLDREAPERQLDPAFDGRTSAIAHGGKQILSAIGLWDRIAPTAEPILDIRVSDDRSLLFLHYDHRELGDDPLGYIVENRQTRAALAGHIAGRAGITVLAPAALESLDRGAAKVTARLAGDTEITARLAVSAEGRESRLRDEAGIAVTRWSYAQTAIVCTMGHERPHQGIAHERFLPSGPFAVLPMTGNRSSIVWTERRDAVAAFLALDDDAFSFELARRFGDSYGRVWVEGGRWSYPLGLLHAERYIDRRLALVGDAAHAIHPIAGQGLNLGLRDVAALAEAIVDANRLGLDIGDALVLERYQRWRRFDTALMLAATDLLNRLFSNDIEPLRLARDLGLAAVNRLPPLKRLFMRHAMGTLGDLPRLARGLPL